MRRSIRIMRIRIIRRVVVIVVTAVTMAAVVDLGAAVLNLDRVHILKTYQCRY